MRFFFLCMLHGFLPSNGRCLALRSLRGARQAEPESRATALARFRSDGTAPALDGDLAEIKSQAGFPRVRLALGEKREELIGRLIGRKTGPFIVNEGEHETVLLLQTDRNRSSFRRV